MRKLLPIFFVLASLTNVHAAENVRIINFPIICKMEKTLEFAFVRSDNPGSTRHENTIWIRKSRIGDILLVKWCRDTKCEEFVMDKYNLTQKSVKMNYFQANLDIQVFLTGEIIENNGAGSITVGKCAFPK